MKQLLSALLVVSSASIASAAPLTWTVEGFGTGVELSGRFDFDAETGIFSEIDLLLLKARGAVVTDDLPPGFLDPLERRLDDEDSDPISRGDSFTFAEFFSGSPSRLTALDDTGTRALKMRMTSPLTNDGGDILFFFGDILCTSLTGFEVQPCATAGLGPDNLLLLPDQAGRVRATPSDGVSEVPLPASFPLLAMAFGLGAFLRRKL